MSGNWYFVTELSPVNGTLQTGHQAREWLLCALRRLFEDVPAPRAEYV